MKSLHLCSSVFICGLFLLCTGCEGMKPMGEFGQRLIDFATGRTPRAAAVKMYDQYFPDERRDGINQLVDRNFGQHPPYTEQYAHVALTDEDYLVRATAVRALNRSRDGSETAIYMAALTDKDERVRLEGAKALANVPDPKAAPLLEKMVADPNETKDVRIAAADALKHYRNLEAARALIAQLGGRDFGIAWQSHKSLVAITGQDMRYDETAWLNLLTGPNNPLG